MRKSEAVEAMRAGQRVRHAYYSKDEYAYMNLANDHIMTEDGCDHGTIHDEFWTKYQTWEDNWEIVEELTHSISAFVKSDPYCFEFTNHYENLPNYRDSFHSCSPRKVEPKPNRNELCSCGSGLKYKKCHGKI